MIEKEVETVIIELKKRLATTYDQKKIALNTKDNIEYQRCVGRIARLRRTVKELRNEFL